MVCEASSNPGKAYKLMVAARASQLTVMPLNIKRYGLEVAIQ